jgi:hypothetical protein
VDLLGLVQDRLSVGVGVQRPLVRRGGLHILPHQNDRQQDELLCSPGRAADLTAWARTDPGALGVVGHGDHRRQQAITATRLAELITLV